MFSLRSPQVISRKLYQIIIIVMMHIAYSYKRVYDKDCRGYESTSLQQNVSKIVARRATEKIVLSLSFLRRQKMKAATLKMEHTRPNKSKKMCHRSSLSTFTFTFWSRSESKLDTQLIAYIYLLAFILIVVLII